MYVCLHAGVQLPAQPENWRQKLLGMSLAGLAALNVCCLQWVPSKLEATWFMCLHASQNSSPGMMT